MSEEIKKVTSVESYRSKLAEPKLITLPSGAVFKIKRLTPIDYIREGLKDIPNEFFKFIVELDTKPGKVNLDTPEAKKNCEIFEEFLTITIEKGVLEPLMVLRYKEEKQDTHLVYAELTIEDQKMLVDIITGKFSF